MDKVKVPRKHAVSPNLGNTHIFQKNRITANFSPADPIVALTSTDGQECSLVGIKSHSNANSVILIQQAAMDSIPTHDPCPRQAEVRALSELAL